jgi:hypothetical protein
MDAANYRISAGRFLNRRLGSLDPNERRSLARTSVSDLPRGPLAPLRVASPVEVGDPPLMRQ